MTSISTAYLTNNAFGRRTAPPAVLLCLHITGNPSNQGPDAAMNERNFANRAGNSGSGAASAHYYIGRDGSAVHAIDEARYFAWSNGVVRNPSPNARRLLAYPLGANAAVRLEIECVGVATTAGQPTDAQLDTVAALVAPYVAKDNLPLDRTTVLGHFDVDSVDRASCPFIPVEHDRMDAVISRIRALVAPKEEDVVHVKPGGPAIGRFKIGKGHSLLSTSDPVGTRYGPWTEGAEFDVLAALDLVDAAGKPVDIDGQQPPQRSRDEVYLIDGLTLDGTPFGASAFALRQDGTFTAPAASPPPATAEPEIAVSEVTITMSDGRVTVIRP